MLKLPPLRRERQWKEPFNMWIIPPDERFPAATGFVGPLGGQGAGRDGGPFHPAESVVLLR